MPCLVTKPPLSAIEVRGLRVRLGDTEVLRGLELNVPLGQIVALIGPNGSGKTTLLRCLLGLQTVDAGEIRLLGEKPAPSILSRIGYVPQLLNTFKPLTITENLDIGGYRLERSARTAAKERMFELFPLLAERRHQKAATLSGGERQLLYYTAYLRLAVSATAEGFLRALLQGKVVLPELSIDQERRWEIVQALARLGAKDAAQMIASELKNDPTDEGQKSAYRAEAQIPDEASKRRWFQRITRTAPSAADNAYVMGNLREAMTHFQIPGQESLLEPFIDPYFDGLAQLVRKGEDNMYLEHMSSAMYPVQCDPRLVTRTTAFLDTHKDLPAGVVKSLRIRRQEVEICLKIQSL